MESLDLVYNTFTNLERNYARSKKSRSEYIKDKFGGDINIGIFLILNALSSEEFTDPEDIRKFSEIRQVFELIKDNQEKLDSLSSFSLEDSKTPTAALGALHTGQEDGTGFTVCSQESLQAIGAFHYAISPASVNISPICLRSKLKTSQVIHVFNPGMAAFFKQFTTDEPVQVGDVLKRAQVGMSFVHVKDHE